MPISAEMRGKNGPTGGKREEREVEKRSREFKPNQKPKTSSFLAGNFFPACRQYFGRRRPQVLPDYEKFCDQTFCLRCFFLLDQKFFLLCFSFLLDQHESHFQASRLFFGTLVGQQQDDDVTTCTTMDSLLVLHEPLSYVCQQLLDPVKSPRPVHGI